MPSPCLRRCEVTGKKGRGEEIFSPEVVQRKQYLHSLFTFHSMNGQTGPFGVCERLAVLGGSLARYFCHPAQIFELKGQFQSGK